MEFVKLTSGRTLTKGGANSFQKQSEIVTLEVVRLRYILSKRLRAPPFPFDLIWFRSDFHFTIVVRSVGSAWDELHMTSKQACTVGDVSPTTQPSAGQSWGWSGTCEQKVYFPIIPALYDFNYNYGIIVRTRNFLLNYKTCTSTTSIHPNCFILVHFGR